MKRLSGSSEKLLVICFAKSESMTWITKSGLVEQNQDLHKTNCSGLQRLLKVIL